MLFPWLQADINRKGRMHDKLDRISSGPFVNTRSVFSRTTLQQGKYCIIPSTFDPGPIGKFLLRVYSSHNPELMYCVVMVTRPNVLCCHGYMS
jgi:hypothetical protein